MGVGARGEWVAAPRQANLAPQVSLAVSGQLVRNTDILACWRIVPGQSYHSETKSDQRTNNSGLDVAIIPVKAMRQTTLNFDKLIVTAGMGRIVSEMRLVPNYDRLVLPNTTMAVCDSSKVRT